MALVFGGGKGRHFVSGSWRPTGEIGWELRLAWWPMAAVRLLPKAFTLMQDAPLAQAPLHPVWQIALVLGPVWTFALAFMCATHACVARHIQQMAHDAKALAGTKTGVSKHS
ncbi:hypothetical protein [Hyphomonas sp.]|uniref:hypothetical protein n=1 Tax=Hyphomonas sp. TaxID=87 RepID=UPI002617ABF3|nr:hypothetical protein [Hyphomonas sp.]MDF1807309.1 hypothetical protein [Hyphomonas sp.]